MNTKDPTPFNRLPLAVLSVLALVLGAAAGLAATPDGETPANEGVCDALLSATPGLYGLCVAFCEAQDCHDLDLAESEQCQASDPKLLELYNARKAATDPAMPCVQTGCPCYTAEEIEQLDPPFDLCVIDSEIITNILRRSFVENPQGEFVLLNEWIPTVLTDSCFFTFADELGTEISRGLFVTDEELGICTQILSDWVDVHGGCPTM